MPELCLPADTLGVRRSTEIESWQSNKWELADGKDSQGERRKETKCKRNNKFILELEGSVISLSRR